MTQRERPIRDVTGNDDDDDSAPVAMDDLPIHSFLGLQFNLLRPDVAVATFRVGQASMQVFRALHGGVSALVAESLGSAAGAVAAGGAPVLGVEVTCSHLRGAPLGAFVAAVARPLRVGRTLQVWEICLYQVRHPGHDGHQDDTGNTRATPLPARAAPAPTVAAQVSGHVELTEEEAQSLPGPIVALLTGQYPQQQQLPNKTQSLVLLAVARLTLAVGLGANRREREEKGIDQQDNERQLGEGLYVGDAGNDGRRRPHSLSRL